MSRRTKSAIAGFGYGTFLLLWALASAGFGHGTYLPLGLAGSPLSPFVRFGFVAAPLSWALTGYAIGQGATRAAAALLGLHVLGAVLCLLRGTPWESASDQWAQLAQASTVMPHVIWPGFAVYLAGVATAVIEARRRRRTPA